MHFAGDYHLIGENSVDFAGRNPRNLVSQVKRLLGADRDVDGNAARDRRDRRPSAACSGEAARAVITIAFHRTLLAVGGKVKGGTNGDGGSHFGAVVLLRDWARENYFGGIELKAIVRHMGEELRLTAREVVANIITQAAGRERYSGDIVRRGVGALALLDVTKKSGHGRSADGRRTHAQGEGRSVVRRKTFLVSYEVVVLHDRRITASK